MSARITPCASCRDRRVKCELLLGSVFCKACNARGEICSGPMPRHDQRRMQRPVAHPGVGSMSHRGANDPIHPEYLRAERRGEQAAAERPREVVPFFADAPPDPGFLAQQTQTLQLQLITQQINALERLLQQVLARLNQQQHPYAPVDVGFVLPVSMPDPQRQIPFGQADNQFAMMDNHLDTQHLPP